jgi:tetratricopeptide (TPR) repeat protein
LRGSAIGIALDIRPALLPKGKKRRDEVIHGLVLRHYNEVPLGLVIMRKLAGVLWVVICLASLSGCRTSKEGYVAKGNKLYDAGKYADAAINYGKAIQKDQHYGEAYYRLGLAEIKDQNPRAAYNALYRAVELAPNNVSAKIQLGSLSLEYYLLDPQRPQNYYNLVKQISDELLAADPKSFEGLRERAYLAMTDGKREESIALFRRALQVNPNDAIGTTALIQNLILTGQDKEAEKVGLDLIAKQKAYGHVYDVLYQMYLKQNRPLDAENILKAKANNNPAQGAYLLELASHYARGQKTAEMQATLDRLLNDPKHFPQARMWVGDFYITLHNYPEAVRYFEEGVRSSKDADKVAYQKRAADALLAEGKGAQASSTVDQIVQETPNDKDALRVQANMRLRSGDPAKIAEAEREFQQLAKQDPNNAAIWFWLGRAEEQRGNLAAARTQYLEALKKNGKYLQARYALAEIGLAEKRPQDTLEQTDVILKVQPDDQRARLLRAQALARTGNPATARVELTRMKDFEHSTQAQLELGRLALSEKKFDEAEQIFGKLRSTGDPQAIAGLASAYVSERKFDKAMEVLGEGIKKSNSLQLLSELGTTEALAGKYDAAAQTFQRLVTLHPNSSQERLQLADVLVLQGDDAGALAAYRQAAKLAPTDLNAGLEFAKALSRAGRGAEARTQYQAVLKAHPESALALNDMAFFLADSGGNLDQALGYAQRALQTEPGQPSYSDTIGYIYLKKGLSDSAVQVFSNLVKKYPKYPTFRYHLGLALLEKGDKKSAKRELDTALAAHPSRQDQARIKVLLGKIG